MNPQGFEKQAYPDSWTLRGVELWSAAQSPRVCDLEFKAGRVYQILPAETTQSRFCLLPAGVDLQVHLRVPGQPQKENAETGLTASLLGGVGALLTMPNTKPVIDTPEVLRAAMNEVHSWEAEFGVKVLFSAALSKGQKGAELVDFSALVAAGAVAFTDDGLGLASDALMREAYRQLGKLNKPLLQHAETPGHGGVLAPGPIQRKLGVPGYGPEPELSMVARDLRILAEVPQARYHLLHVSTAGAIEMITAAKARGLIATVEVSPHHLWWSTEDLDENNPSFKMNPPIRTAEDREALQKALASGAIDWVATDHAPHESEAKTEFSKASFGCIGLETLLPVLLGLYAQKKLSEKRLVEVFSARPARFIGLSGKEGWGDISSGVPFRGVLIDRERPWKIWNQADFHSLSKNSCFIGTRLPDRPLAHFTSAGLFAFDRGVRFERGSLRVH